MFFGLAFFAREMKRIAEANHRDISSCAEKVVLSAYGIAHGSCINQELIEKILGCTISGKIDEGDRTTERKMFSLKEGQYHLF